jgi:hypothetical protein
MMSRITLSAEDHLVARIHEAEGLIGEVLEGVDGALHGHQQTLMIVTGARHDGISRIYKLEVGIVEPNRADRLSGHFAARDAPSRASPAPRGFSRK